MEENFLEGLEKCLSEKLWKLSTKNAAASLALTHNFWGHRYYYLALESSYRILPSSSEEKVFRPKMKPDGNKWAVMFRFFTGRCLQINDCHSILLFLPMQHPNKY